MDKLMFAFRNHYAWEVNIRTRLVADDYVWNETDIVDRLRTSG
jgi:hypothetical protein